MRKTHFSRVRSARRASLELSKLSLSLSLFSITLCHFRVGAHARAEFARSPRRGDSPRGRAHAKNPRVPSHRARSETETSSFREAFRSPMRSHTHASLLLLLEAKCENGPPPKPNQNECFSQNWRTRRVKIAHRVRVFPTLAAKECVNWNPAARSYDAKWRVLALSSRFAETARLARDFSASRTGVSLSLSSLGAKTSLSTRHKRSLSVFFFRRGERSKGAGSRVGTRAIETPFGDRRVSRDSYLAIFACDFRGDAGLGGHFSGEHGTQRSTFSLKEKRAVSEERVSFFNFFKDPFRWRCSRRSRRNSRGHSVSNDRNRCGRLN